MILDKRTLLSDEQAITATALSTNVIDLRALGLTYDGIQLQRREGTMQKVPLLVQVIQDFATLTSLAITIETSASADMSASTVKHSETILLADLVAGKKLSYDYLPNDITQRYLAVRYTVNGLDATAGAIVAGIVTAVDHAYKG